MNENETPDSPPTVAVARFDAAGVYQGIEQIPADQVTDNHVPLPDGCDLPSGRYFWDRDKATFMPLASPQQRAVEAPVALNALAWGLLAMHAAGMRLPKASLNWLDHYIGTIDFLGSHGSNEEAALMQAYAIERGIK